MTKTETMPRLRQYLRERGFEKDANFGIYIKPDLVIFIDDDEVPIRIYPSNDDYWLAGMPTEFTDEEAAIDWLEANYPKL